MLRIIAGKYKGKKLLVPSVSRPITDRIRTSIFDTLSPIINHANVLDLYAGSGAFGLESLSRGAHFVTFVEDSKEAASIISENVKNTKSVQSISIVRERVKDYLNKTPSELFDLIMIDPPFPLPIEEKLKDVSDASKFLNKEGIIVFRLPSKERFNESIPGLSHLFSKNMGVSCINYYKKQ